MTVISALQDSTNRYIHENESLKMMVLGQLNLPSHIWTASERGQKTFSYMKRLFCPEISIKKTLLSSCCFSMFS